MRQKRAHFRYRYQRNPGRFTMIAAGLAAASVITGAALSLLAPGSNSSTAPATTGTAGASVAGQVTGGVTGQCVTGYQNMFGTNGVQVGSDNDGAQAPVFAAGPVPPGITAAPAYQVTLANSGSGSQVVTAYAVMFFDGAGNENGSETMKVSTTYLAAGQSLTWTQGIGDANAGGADYVDSLIPFAASCSVADVAPASLVAP